MGYDRIKYRDLLVKRIFDQAMTPQEDALLKEWVDEDPKNKDLYDQLTSPEQLAKIFALDEASQKKNLQVVLDLINRSEAAESAPEQIQIRSRRSLFIRIGWGLSIAASVCIIVGIGVMIYLINNKDIKPRTIAAMQPADIKPGSASAILVLGDGTEMALDSANANFSKDQGNALVKGQPGTLAYQPGRHSGQAALTFNTLIVPKGAEYELHLSDGTIVRLNAGTRLRYPTTFSATERSVELTGEAYFEVAKNPSAPFTVVLPKDTRNQPSATDQKITVLGTHFNVNGYPEDGRIITTLLEGKVKVDYGASSATLLPGQQAYTVPGDKGIAVREHADTAAAVAWKNGLFYLKGVKLPDLLRQVSRWYNIDVKITGQLGEQEYYGYVNRRTSLESILNYLERYGVHSKLDNGILEIYQ
jgi:transmembrane sensor